MIRCYLEGKQKDWDKNLQLIGMAIRSMVNRSTGFTPNYLMLGREISIPNELFGLKSEKQYTDIPEYVQKLIEDKRRR